MQFRKKPKLNPISGQKSNQGFLIVLFPHSISKSYSNYGQFAIKHNPLKELKNQTLMTVQNC